MSDSPATVHPTAVIGPRAKIGVGTRIWHFCHVMDGAQIGSDVVLGQNTFVGSRVRVGDGCRIQNNVSLYDGVILEDGVFVGPSAVFTNVRRPRARFPRKDRFETTLVQSEATIGANATVRCGLTVGRGAMVAAGAVVVDDVPPFALVAGIPAARKAWVCLCGEQVGDDLACTSCSRRYGRDGSGLELLEGS